jgi:mono/diheme cytochrome c family protein
MTRPFLHLGIAAVVWMAPLRAGHAAPPAPSTPQLEEKGRQTYQIHCAPCHGEAGQGDGPAAYLLYPKPRNFAKAQYRLVSTWEQVPTDEDLFGVITRGMPGSAMPSWPSLSEETRWGLVHYIKSLADHPLVYGEPTPPPADGGPGTGLIEVPPEPPYDEAAQQRAAELFAQGCAGCHGATGKGDGQTKQIDSDGYPTRPRDLSRGIYKGAPTPQEVYRRIVAGLPGTPMPMSDWAPGADAWALTRYVLSMSSQRQRQRNEMLKFSIAAPRVPKLPSHPDDGEWRAADPVNLHLMPLWWRDDRVEEVTVRALHDGAELAVLLEWHDETDDHTAIRPQDFRDAAAVQFSLSPDPPFFGMGSLGRAVNIWMWKAERQADLVAFQDLEAVYPNIGIDSYPNLLKSPLEQPMRHALTLESDPTFVTGWGAGNIVSDPTRKNAAEDLQAQGQGTLKAHPRFDQEVVAEGVYQSNSYHVVFRRTFKPKGKEGVVLKPGAAVPVAFAVWNGSHGDRDGKKSVTIWQELELAP